MHFHNREKVIEIERTEIASVKENIIYFYPFELKGNASRAINCNDISIRDEIIELFQENFFFYVLVQRCVFVGSEKSQT